MKSFVLLLIAIALFVIIAPLGFLIECVFHLFIINRYLKRVAIGIDQMGNVICANLFNFMFINRVGYKFGDEDETISYVLGINKRLNTLLPMGSILASILNHVDTDHLENAIKNQQSKTKLWTK